MPNQGDPSSGRYGHTPDIPPEAPADKSMFSYGDLWWLTRIPELTGFVSQWQAKLGEEGWIEKHPGQLAADFHNELSQTDWWTQRTDEQREAARLRNTDLATWNEMVSVQRDDAAIWASQLGYTLTDEQLDDIADDAATRGLTQAEIEREILNKAYYEADGPVSVGAGSVRAAYDQLRGYAADWMIRMRPERLWEFANDIKSEKKSLDQVERLIADTATLEYDWLEPSFVDRLYSSGATIADHLEPVRQSVANVWGMDGSELSLQDDWFTDSLVTSDDKGNRRFINSREAKALAYQDPRYKQTDEYRGKMNQFGGAMAEFFGVRSWR